MAGVAKDIKGLIYGNYTVLDEVGRRDKHRMFTCKCVCGLEQVLSYSGLLAAKKRNSARLCKHGLSSQPEYPAWDYIRSKFPELVCPEWLNNFTKFREDMGDRPEHSVLERRDSSRPYSKENCRWVVRRRLKRRTKRLNGPTWMLD